MKAWPSSIHLMKPSLSGSGRSPVVLAKITPSIFSFSRFSGESGSSAFFTASPNLAPAIPCTPCLAPGVHFAISSSYFFMSASYLRLRLVVGVGLEIARLARRLRDLVRLRLAHEFDDREGLRLVGELLQRLLRVGDRGVAEAGGDGADDHALRLGGGAEEGERESGERRRQEEFFHKGSDGLSRGRGRT